MNNDLVVLVPSPDIADAIEAYCTSFFDAGEDHVDGAIGIQRGASVREWLEHRLWATFEGARHHTFFTYSVTEDSIVGCFRVTPDNAPGQFITSALNIGQSIAPEFRGKGYGTKQLKTALKYCRMLGMDFALAGVRRNNLASTAVVKKCGGVDIGCWDSIHAIWKLPTNI